jgi:hypothetical protein
MDILWHTARRLGAKLWADEGAAISAHVLSLAGPLDDPLAAQDEGEWRGQCENYINAFLTKNHTI